MADFESTANAAVTTLEEVRTLSGTVGTNYIDKMPELEIMANENRELTTSLMSGIASLEQKVASATTDSREKVSELQEKLTELSSRAVVLRDSIKGSIQQREEKIKSYDSQVEEQVDKAKELTDQLVFNIEGTRDALDESNEALAEVFTKVEQRIEDSAKGLQELEDTLENEVETFGQFVVQRGTSQLKQSMTDVSEKLMDNFYAWNTKMDEYSELLQSALRQTPESAAEYQDDGWEKLQEYIDTMSETYNLESTDELSGKFSKALTDLNEQMKASEKVYDSIDQKTVDVADVLRKAASR